MNELIINDLKAVNLYNKVKPKRHCGLITQLKISS